MNFPIRAFIFDLDGVLTDTAEYHYCAWQRLADEEAIPFDREINEQLRGVSRQRSLEIILAGRQVEPDRFDEMMARKNAYYVAMLDQIGPNDLLPGALELMNELKAAGIKIALASASKNARPVVERLGIGPYLDAIADGHSVERTKPAPDLFFFAARELGVDPSTAVVVEDAAAGIEAALAADMWAVGIGPAERVGTAHARFDSLEGVHLADILAALVATGPAAADPRWVVVENNFDPANLHHKETVFTSGNGYMSTRGTFEEGHPDEQAGAFMHRVWDDVPVVFTELVNLPRWWGLRITINGERFRLDRGAIVAYRRWLDLRTGLLSRTVRWRLNDGSEVAFTFERFSSLAEHHLSAVRARVTVVKGEATIRIDVGLNSHVDNLGVRHWDLVAQGESEQQVWLQTRTHYTRLDLGVAAHVLPVGAAVASTRVSDADGQPAVICEYGRLRAGEEATIEKYVSAFSQYEAEAPAAAARTAVTAAAERGFDVLFADNAAAWATTWEKADVIVEGDDEAQLALRFNIFQLLISAPRHTEHASIGAKTLSGYGYRGHVFWDTEIFILPFFTFTHPEVARNLLMYRYHNLPGARAKSLANGFEGAQFPWESAATGVEVTPTWIPHFQDPTRFVRIWTGDIEIHITADITYAVLQYWAVTGDDAWMRDYGAELVVDGTAFWASRARLEDDGDYHFRDVIGPDEYHERVDDNVFTNVMAQWHLRTALRVLAWLRNTAPEKAAELEDRLRLTPERLAEWAAIADRIIIRQDPDTGLMEQFAGYFALEDADLELLRDPRRTRSMQVILGIEETNHNQVLKQPDVLMLLFLLREQYSQAVIRANWDYYNPRTDHEHGSSLGPSITATMACLMGEPDEAYVHFMRAARADLQDVRHNAGDGIHAASAGGLWQAAVFGFGGLKIRGDEWHVEPKLPSHWHRLAFRFCFRGQPQQVDIVPERQEQRAAGEPTPVPSPETASDGG
ncbi:MAG: beta-phosphoglucomutase [Ardenticatenaceae bacterium]|nr:beta-phosphoglucomutase [Ardenticatenaceae bacterium]